MNSKDVKGIQAISAADAAKLGTVERAYLDPVARRIVGFAVGTGAHLFGSESSRMVDVGEVEALGPDALTVADQASAHGAETIARYGDLIDLDDLTRRQVYTEGGIHIGGVAAVAFDERSFALTEIETTPGFFQKHTVVPVDQVVTVGPELIVVRDEVGAPAREASPSPAAPPTDAAPPAGAPAVPSPS